MSTKPKIISNYTLKLLFISALFKLVIFKIYIYIITNNFLNIYMKRKQNVLGAKFNHNIIVNVEQTFKNYNHKNILMLKNL